MLDLQYNFCYHSKAVVQFPCLIVNDSSATKESIRISAMSSGEQISLKFYINSILNK